MGRQGKPSQRLHARLIGREEELNAGKSHLSESISGSGRLVFIVGERGVGKSRYLAELGQYARSRGTVFLYSRCPNLENAQPYMPFTRAFDRYTSKEDRLSEREGGPDSWGLPERPHSLNLLPILADYTPENSGNERLNIREERDRLFESLYNAVIDISETDPLLLVLDDLQWADTGTLRLLHYMARNIRHSRILICGAYSPEDLKEREDGKHPLAETVQRMRVEKLFSEISLGRLTREQTRDMIESMVGREQLSSDLLRLLYEESDGNPFFVEEVLKSLVNDGAIELGNHGKGTDPSSLRLRIPGTLNDVIARRIEGLDHQTKEILRYCAVIGNSFTFDLLHRIALLSEEELIDSIDAALSADVIREDGDSNEERYKFDHTLTREVIYGGIKESRQRGLHKQIGEALEDIYRERIDDVAHALAHHYQCAGDKEKTLLYAIKGGTKAADSFSPEDAITFFLMALDTLRDMDDNNRKNIMEMAVCSKLGDIHGTIGEWENALSYHNHALEIGYILNNEIGVARELRALGHIKQNVGDYDGALEDFQGALEIAWRIGDEHSAADIFRGAGRVYWRKGEFDKAIQYLERSLDITQDNRDDKIIATTCIELGNVYSELSEWRKAIEYQQMSLDLLQKHHDLNEMGRNYNNMGVTYARWGDLEKAIENYEKSIELSDKAGNIRMVGWALFNAGEAYARTGSFDRAMECCEKSLSIFERLDEKLGISGAFLSFGIVYKLKKEWDTAIQYFDESMRLREELDMPYRLADGYLEFGLLMKEKGDLDRAREFFKKARDIFMHLGADKLCRKTEEELKNINVMKSHMER